MLFVIAMFFAIVVFDDVVLVVAAGVAVVVFCRRCQPMTNTIICFQSTKFVGIIFLKQNSEFLYFHSENIA